jgi:predicted nucleotidyltransferase
LLDMSRVVEGFLDPIARVVEAMREQAPEINSDEIMLVGAWCRDTLHAVLGHDFDTSATRDVDLALALSGWEIYERLADAFPRAGTSGVGFQITGLVVDLLPFGELENPTGSIVPPTRGEVISVWAFAEIFQDSSLLPLGPSLAIRCPTVPGYTAAKLAAWLDRSEWGEARDANDLALSVYWYAESKQIEGRLYDTPEGQQVLLAEEADVPRAAARLLARDVSAMVGPDRLNELIQRWPGDFDMLVRNFTLKTGPQWLTQEDRRREVVDALTRGLANST